ncbi:MAG: hypothetical protein PWQ50_2010 [Methanolobus sp.]|nr:hypothetical protein [Methanolobus sp.]
MAGDTISDKKGNMKFVILAVGLVVLGSIFWVYGSFSLFGPKDLGVRYTHEDYVSAFSDYQEKQFTLTAEESTALLNEIAPGFWWFDNLQVKVLPDGTMEGSSTADIGRLKTDLYSDVAGDVPIPLPDTLNIYSKGKISVTDNKLSGDPESFYLGAVPLSEKYLEEDSVNTMEEYFPRIYTVVPGLEINSLSSNSEGEFVFDGVIPQKVSVTKK